MEILGYSILQSCSSSSTTLTSDYYQRVFSRIEATVVPVVYLKSNLKIQSGSGTEADPYILGI